MLFSQDCTILKIGPDDPVYNDTDNLFCYFDTESSDLYDLLLYSVTIYYKNDRDKHHQYQDEYCSRPSVLLP